MESREHIAELLSVSEFDSTEFTPTRIEKGLVVLNGMVKGIPRVQSYRFDPDVFSPIVINDWLRRHNIKFTKFIEGGQEVKLGARHSTRDKQLIQKVHSMAQEIMSHMKELGYEEEKKASDEIPDEWLTEWKGTI